MRNRTRIALVTLLAAILLGGGAASWMILRGKPAITYQNPVFEPVLADPSVIRGQDGYFYAYGTEDDWGGAHGPHLMPILKSKDLTKWEFVSDALAEKPVWKEDGGGLWAPDISLHPNGKYYLYYAFSSWGDPNPAIGVATADHPAGPFTDHGKLLRSDEIGVSNSIDPAYVRGEDGKQYMIWGSFRGIYGIELSEDGLTTVGEKFELASNQFEAPYIIQRNGYFYMFLSSGSCCEGAKSGYFVTVGRSKSIRGPYLNKNGEDLLTALGTPVLLGNNPEKRPETHFVGPGHNAIVKDDEGTDWMIYHAIDVRNPNLDNGATRRPLMIDPVVWDGEWPVIEGTEPSNGPRKGPALHK